MDQGPASQTQFASLRRAVEMLGAMQMVIEPAQEPVYQLTRPMAAGMSVCLGERCVFVAQRQHLLPNNLLEPFKLVPGP